MLIDAEKLPILEKANEGDPYSLSQMAIWYYLGVNVPKDKEKAKYYHDKLLLFDIDTINRVTQNEYLDVILMAGYMRFNNGEIQSAKKYLQKAIDYIEKTYPIYVSEQKIEQHGIRSVIGRIDRIIKEEKKEGLEQSFIRKFYFQFFRCFFDICNKIIDMFVRNNRV